MSKKPLLTNGILAGLWLGLATLTRPNSLAILAWIAVLALVFYIIGKEYKIQNLFNIKTIKSKILSIPKQYIRSCTLAAIIFIIVISPWTIYASNKIGTFTPIASNLSGVFAGTNSSYINEWGYYKTPGYEPWAEVTPKKIAIIKIKNFFRFWKSGASGYQAEALANKYSFGKHLLTLYRIEFYLILLLTFLSLTSIKDNKTILLFWIIIVYFWCMSTVLHPLPRYRMPINPLVIILAFYSFYNLLNKYKSFSIQRLNKTKKSSIPPK